MPKQKKPETAAPVRPPVLFPAIDRPDDFRHIFYTCRDGVERCFLSYTLAHLRQHADTLLVMQQNDPWVAYMFDVMIGPDPEPAVRAPVELKALFDFLELLFSPDYCSAPLAPDAIEAAIDPSDVCRLVKIATGVASREKQETYEGLRQIESAG